MRKRVPPRFHRNMLTLMTPDIYHETPGQLAPGTIRRYFSAPPRQTGGADPAFSWSRNSSSIPGPVLGLVSSTVKFLIGTRNLAVAGRYARPMPSKQDVMNSRNLRYPQVVTTAHAGDLQGRPFIRNRIMPLGLRIPPVNSPVPSAYPES